MIAYDNGQIGKDGLFYEGCDVSWLPSDILVVQSPDGVTCTFEKGDRATLRHTENQENIATSSLSWWSNVDSTWQAAHDAELALESGE